jgi:hypothetical protein
MGPEHEFQLVLIKKQAEECQDINAMRELIYKTVEMLEVQRQFLFQKLEEGWAKKPA